MNHDFFAVSVLPHARSCIPAAPQAPSDAPPTQVVAGDSLCPEAGARV